VSHAQDARSFLEQSQKTNSSQPKDFARPHFLNSLPEIGTGKGAKAMRKLSFIFVLAFVVSVSGQPRRVMLQFDQATKLAKNGEFEKAISRFQEALDRSEGTRLDNDHLAQLHYNLGVCEYHLNHPERAVAELKVAIKLKDGNYSTAFYALGMAESARANWQSARLAFLESLRLNRSNGEAWFDLAFVYLAAGDFARAEAAFRNSIVYKSIDCAWSHNNVGVLLALRGELSEAQKEFEAALAASAGKLIEAQTNLEYCRAREPKRVGLLGKGELKLTGRDAGR
jgi:tetratricopeptide (TPR) repeat protein